MLSSNNLPVIQAASRDNTQSDTTSKKAVLSKNAKGQTSANLSIKGMSGEKILGATIDSVQDNNTMLDLSIVEMDKMNSKIQHMEITNMLFETEPKIKDKSTYMTPATNVTPPLKMKPTGPTLDEMLMSRSSQGHDGAKQAFAITRLEEERSKAEL